MDCIKISSGVTKFDISQHQILLHEADQCNQTGYTILIIPFNSIIRILEIQFMQQLQYSAVPATRVDELC